METLLPTQGTYWPDVCSANATFALPFRQSAALQRLLFIKLSDRPSRLNSRLRDVRAAALQGGMAVTAATIGWRSARLRPRRLRHRCRGTKREPMRLPRGNGGTPYEHQGCPPRDAARRSRD